MTGLVGRSGEQELVAQVVGDVREFIGPALVVDADLVAAAVRGWSHNTRRAFRSDLTIWGRWCRSKGRTPARADAKMVAEWIRALAGVDPSAEKIRAMATIERYLVNVGWAYRMAGLEDPTAAPLVKLEKKAARKIRGTRQRQARAIRFKGDVTDLDAPATGVSLSALLKATRSDMLGARDRALLRVAYDTGCRRSELAAILVTDIDGPDAEGAGLLEIARSKTDQEGQGMLAYLSPPTMRAIEVWRDLAQIDRGALFRRVETYFDGSIRGVGEGALNPGTITLIYKRLIRQAFDKKLLGPVSEAELERWVAGVSSHSIRVGVAQDNFAAGESLPAIMQAYRWRDPKTVMRYGARLAAKSGASARMAARFSK
ncbi:MAG: tyrosine-type recombinase/integrase [Sphingobium sp.]